MDLSLFAVAFRIGSFSVHWYGVIISISMLIAMFIAYREILRQHLNPDHFLDLLLLIIPSAIVGARLYLLEAGGDS